MNANLVKCNVGERGESRIPDGLSSWGREDEQSGGWVAAYGGWKRIRQARRGIMVE